MNYWYSIYENKVKEEKTEVKGYILHVRRKLMQN